MSILLLRRTEESPQPTLVLPIDKREAVHWQSRRGQPIVAVVEHIGVAPTFDSLWGYLKSNNDRSVSATFVIGGDYVGQWCLVVGSGQGYDLDNEKMLRAGNHAGIQSFPNTNPLPGIANPNWWTIGKEHVGYPGQVWTPAMIQNDIDCNNYIRACLGPLAFTHVLSHRNFDPVNRANCPGPTFPWGPVYGMQVPRAASEIVSAMRSISKKKLKSLDVGDWDGYNMLLDEQPKGEQ